MDVHIDSGRARDLEPNLSAFTAGLGNTFELRVTTYSVVSLREELGSLFPD